MSLQGHVLTERFTFRDTDPRYISIHTTITAIYMFGVMASGENIWKPVRMQTITDSRITFVLRARVDGWIILRSGAP